MFDRADLIDYYIRCNGHDQEYAEKMADKTLAYGNNIPGGLSSVIQRWLDLPEHEKPHTSAANSLKKSQRYERLDMTTPYVGVYNTEALNNWMETD
jgi:hypothetical protein